MTSEDNKSDERAVAFFLNSSGSFLREKHFLPPRSLEGSNSSKRRNVASRFNIRQVFLGGISWKYPRLVSSSNRLHSFILSLVIPGEFILEGFFFMWVSGKFFVASKACFNIFFKWELGVAKRCTVCWIEWIFFFRLL